MLPVRAKCRHCSSLNDVRWGRYYCPKCGHDCTRSIKDCDCLRCQDRKASELMDRLTNQATRRKQVRS